MSAEAPTREAIDEAHARLEAEAGGAERQKDGGDIVPNPPEEIRVDGTTQLGLIDFGGKRPTSAVITLTGGQFELNDGQAYAKGDTVTFSGTAVVQAVGARDKFDPKTGIVVACKQSHSALVIDLRVRPA